MIPTPEALKRIEDGWRRDCQRKRERYRTEPGYRESAL